MLGHRARARSSTSPTTSRRTTSAPARSPSCARCSTCPTASCSRSSTPASGTDRRLRGGRDRVGLLLGPDNGLLAPAVAMIGGATRAVLAHERGLPPARAGPDLRGPRRARARGGPPRGGRRRSTSSARDRPGRADPRPRDAAARSRTARSSARSGGSTGSATASSTSTPTSSRPLGAAPAAGSRCGSGPRRGGALGRDLRRREAVGARPARRLLRPAVARSTGSRRPAELGLRAGSGVTLVRRRRQPSPSRSVTRSSHEARYHHRRIVVLLVLIFAAAAASRPPTRALVTALAHPSRGARARAVRSWRALGRSLPRHPARLLQPCFATHCPPQLVAIGNVSVRHFEPLTLLLRLRLLRPPGGGPTNGEHHLVAAIGVHGPDAARRARTRCGRPSETTTAARHPRRAGPGSEAPSTFAEPDSRGPGHVVHVWPTGRDLRAVRW